MYNVGDKVLSNIGEKVIITDVFANKDGENVYSATNEFGTEHIYFGNELNSVVEPIKLNVEVCEDRVILELETNGRTESTFGWIKDNNAYGVAQALNSAAYRMMTKFESTDGTMTYDEFIRRQNVRS